MKRLGFGFKNRELLAILKTLNLRISYSRPTIRDCCPAVGASPVSVKFIVEGPQNVENIISEME